MLLAYFVAPNEVVAQWIPDTSVQVLFWHYHWIFIYFLIESNRINPPRSNLAIRSCDIQRLNNSVSIVWPFSRVCVLLYLLQWPKQTENTIIPLKWNAIECSQRMNLNRSVKRNRWHRKVNRNLSEWKCQIFDFHTPIRNWKKATKQWMHHKQSIERRNTRPTLSEVSNRIV